MSTKKALISCVTPTFNRSHLIARAIESTMNQTYQHWEMIIVDDGSVDNTKEVVDSYSCIDSRIKYYRNPGKGGNAARNFGIMQAQGRWIAFLDDDDISLPHRFISQLEVAQSKRSRFVVSGYQVISDTFGHKKKEYKLELNGMGAGFPSRWFIEKTLLLEVKGFDENFPSMQDVELSYRLGKHEVFVLHDNVVSVLYQTKNSVSTNTVNALKGKELLFEKHKYNMPRIEAASWCFTIGITNYRINNRERAIDYIANGARLDRRLNTIVLKLYFNVFCRNRRSFKKLHLKILTYLYKYKFPRIIKHEIA